jgi:putative lipoprotein
MPRPRALVLVIAIGLGRGPAVAAAAEDPWLGRDKALHFGASLSIAAGGYALAVPFTDSPLVRAAVGGGLALAAGIGKEVWDANGPGDASWRDFTWDLAGTATGILIAATIDWIVRRSFERRPAPSGLAP